ncbi:hypothetical protein DRE_03434 [Drechslerella stenobrocha 248]|uniref:Uncharacterized protein n=1 Tax=Drechslerella stenobrocha 248 TaxID=1043628 RepID=W7IE74_9PEZI|nr:hypothetical protein DRE_03434 [Drechslerella stenobrocha 248]
MTSSSATADTTPRRDAHGEPAPAPAVKTSAESVCYDDDGQVISSIETQQVDDGTASNGKSGNTGTNKLRKRGGCISTAVKHIVNPGAEFYADPIPEVVLDTRPADQWPGAGTHYASYRPHEVPLDLDLSLSGPLFSLPVGMDADAGTGAGGGAGGRRDGVRLEGGNDERERFRVAVEALDTLDAQEEEGVVPEEYEDGMRAYLNGAVRESRGLSLLSGGLEDEGEDGDKLTGWENPVSAGSAGSTGTLAEYATDRGVVPVSNYQGAGGLLGAVGGGLANPGMNDATAATGNGLATGSPLTAGAVTNGAGGGGNMLDDNSDYTIIDADEIARLEAENGLL